MLDELKLKLSTKFMKNIVSKLISKTISKKIGCEVKVLLNDIEIESYGGNVYVHMDVDGEITSDNFVKLVKSAGLD